MKRTFSLTHPKIKAPRMADAAKHQVNKYLKRERRKTLPDGADYWDFDCKYGQTEEEAEVIHLSEISKRIDEAESSGLESFYVEIVAKLGYRTKKT